MNSEWEQPLRITALKEEPFTGNWERGRVQKFLHKLRTLSITVDNYILLNVTFLGLICNKRHLCCICCLSLGGALWIFDFLMVRERERERESKSKLKSFVWLLQTLMARGRALPRWAVLKIVWRMKKFIDNIATLYNSLFIIAHCQLVWICVDSGADHLGAIIVIFEYLK